MASELHLRLGIDEARTGAYLQRLALELPGWAGMFHWRESHAAGDDAPVRLADLLAVRLILERLHAEHLVHRVWGLPLPLAELGEYFARHPAELAVRHACGNRQLPEELLAAVRPQLAWPSADVHDGWRHVAVALAEARNAGMEDSERAELAAWPLFCAASLSRDQRGQVWLLAYEHHYRQQIFAALAANHGRAAALAGKAEAQFVFCMDDREEGSRRHLEEVNPAFETFGAAGFFGVPMLWQGLDDEAPSALCPIVVRPTNAIREEVPSGARRHSKRISGAGSCASPGASACIRAAGAAGCRQRC
jgi:uncharacterized protein YbcC (UPF0753/DUF2309 family)